MLFPDSFYHQIAHPITIIPLLLWSHNPSRISPPLHPTSARTAVLIQLAAQGIDDAQIGTGQEAIHRPGEMRGQQG